MSFFKFKRAKKAASANISARARMARSMPGEVAALASIRLGGMSI